MRRENEGIIKREGMEGRKNQSDRRENEGSERISKIEESMKE